jgi:ABC-type dipeptide/oligopeptide/nickel transport system ATPase component
MASSSSYFSWNTKRTDETPSDYLNLSTNEVKNIGLVGEARSGKSSFVKAIMRYASLFDSTTMFKLSS